MHARQPDTIDIIECEHDLPANYADLIRTRGVVAWDIETTNLDWHTEHIVTIQVYTDGMPVVVVYTDSAPPTRLLELLADARVRKIFHYAVFDLSFLMRAWDVVPANVACTKVASKLLDPEQALRHSLKNLVERHLQISIDKAAKKSNWDVARLSPEQLRYVREDVIFLAPLLETLQSALATKGLAGLAEECFLHLPARVRLELGEHGDVFSY